MTKSNSNSTALWAGAKKPLLLVLSGPSGAGKDAVLNKLKIVHSPIAHITTMTTRAKRPKEKDGVDYNFVTIEQFQKLIDDNELLEYAKVYDNFYGVPKQPVRDAGCRKRHHYQNRRSGAASIKKICRRQFLYFWPLTPQELVDRLTMRNTESQENLKLRIDTVKRCLKSACSITSPSTNTAKSTAS